jgi:hypothetical protein
MKTLTRRSFIKTSLIASASLSPVGAALTAYGISAAEIEAALNKEFDQDPQFHLVDNSLLNLHFYFLNVKRDGGSLIPNNPSQSSSNLRYEFWTVLMIRCRFTNLQCRRRILSNCSRENYG